MPPEWIDNGLAVLAGLSVPILGILGWKVTHRAQKSTERDQARQLDHAAITQITSVAKMLQVERDHTDQKLNATNERLDKTADELRQARNEIDILTLNFRRLEGRLVAAIDYIRRLLAWAGSVAHPVPHPTIPDDIADLINTRDKS
jgi:septal ring factor EnvC (AmiA/AmiB activator)